ncbi:metallophosphoesterase [Domibacillus sp. A3M-37]|uniref:metallophosphoesterase n=1 Tax=Domibacillus sp. A3M-37 TaxID=2962037 RepID=UPI0020B71B8C|nr:metallophosphoesterase [Domibacillus sp. A3M-37]MCP3764208.1 metallophosphoesterase [Domibacillus sp. A3M-37]
MLIKLRKPVMAQKFMYTSASVALGLSLFASTSVSAERNENERTDKKPSFEFGLITDIQYCDCDTAGVRYYRNSISKLQEATAELNRHDLKFTVQMGDMIDRNLDSFHTILPYFNKIEGRKYNVLGNHDFAVPTDQVVDILGMKNQYYDFTEKGWRFVVLDTNDLSLYANEPGSAKYQQAEKMYNQLKASGAENAQTWNGGAGSEQMIWLHNVLKKSVKKNEKVVVIGHHPVYPANEHNAWNDAEIMRELESAGNVAAYFNGHNHAGNYSEKNGIKYVNFRGMLDTPDTNAYSVIKAFKDRLEIDGFGREPDRTIKVNTIHEHDQEQNENDEH